MKDIKLHHFSKLYKKIICMSIVLIMGFTSFLIPEKAGGQNTEVFASSSTTYAVPVVPRPIYTVYFNGNKGKVSQKSKLVQYTNIYGSLPKPTRKKYTFRGWYTKKKGGTKITQYSSYYVRGNQTLYARWQKTTSYEKSVMKAINKERKKKRLKKLKWDKKLYKGTKKRAKEITKKFSHRRPKGGSGAKFLLKYVKKGRSSGECLGKGFDDPNQLVKAFMKSPSHRRIIMMKKARTCAVSSRVKGGTTYWAVGTSSLHKR